MQPANWTSGRPVLGVQCSVCPRSHMECASMYVVSEGFRAHYICQRHDLPVELHGWGRGDLSYKPQVRPGSRRKHLPREWRDSRAFVAHVSYSPPRGCECLGCRKTQYLLKWLLGDSSVRGAAGGREPSFRTAPSPASASRTARHPTPCSSGRCHYRSAEHQPWRDCWQLRSSTENQG